MSKKGLEKERLLSFKLHQKYTPLLISSQLLRRLGCGQIDISYVSNNELVIVESKSSGVGVSSMGKVQLKRLERSVALLSSLLSMPVKLKIIAKR